MADDVLKFVQSIGTPGTVRLNLTDGTTWRLLADGTSFDPPPLDAPVITSPMVDGGLIPWTAYRNRVVVLHLQLKAASADAIATQLQLLGRELDRERNTLMWQPATATHAVYFRTHRAAIRSIEDVLRGHKRVTVEIEADPWAYGAVETLSPVTVTNDPAAGSNGMYFDVSSVKGDCETPLHLSITASNVIASGRRRSLIGVRRGGTPAAAAFVIQAENMTLGSSTTLPGNDAAMSGSSSNYARLSSLSSTAAVRLTSSLYPASASADVRGTYRVVGRFRQTVGTDAFRATLQWSGDGTNWISQDTVLLPGGTALRMVDMKVLVQLPIGEDIAADDLTDDTLAVRGAQFRLAVSRDSGGTGNLDVDYLLFVPADDCCLPILWPGTSGPTTMEIGWNADRQRLTVTGRGSSGEVYSPEIAQAAGGMPHVSPGVTNRLAVVLDTNTTDAKTNTVAFTGRYRPRYFRVKPATT